MSKNNTELTNELEVVKSSIKATADSLRRIRDKITNAEVVLDSIEDKLTRAQEQLSEDKIESDLIEPTAEDIVDLEELDNAVELALKEDDFEGITKPNKGGERIFQE